MRIDENVKVIVGTRAQIEARLAELQRQREQVLPKASKEEDPPSMFS